MADHWVCSECGEECEIVEASNNPNISDQRSECCGAIPEYREQDKEYDLDRDYYDGPGWDPNKIDY